MTVSRRVFRVVLAPSLMLWACLSAAAADLTGKSPQEVYAVYEKAIVDYDIETYFGCLSADLQGTSKETHQQLMMAKRLGVTTQNIKVENAAVEGDQATLTLKGTESGILTMVKEDGVWKINSAEKWGQGGAPPEPAAPQIEEFATAGLKAPGMSDPQVMRLAWNVMTECDKVLTQVANARRLMGEAAGSKTKVDSAVSAAMAKASAGDMAEQLNAAKEAQDLANTAIKDALAALEKVEEMKRNVEAQREAERQAAEAALAAQRAEEELIRKQEEHKVKVLQETANAEVARAEALILIKQHSYQEAIDGLKGRLDAYETEEGKALMGILIERVGRLKDLKDFVIERLNSSPYRWGWGLSTSTAVDVIGADNLGVKLKDRTVDWSQVSTGQMLKFVDHYIVPPESKKLQLKVLAEQNMAAAILCFENNRADGVGKYADKTAELLPAYAEELSRLIPR